MRKQMIFGVLCVFFLSNCAVVRQGEVGVKRKMGKLQDKVYTSGAVGYNPFFATVIKVPVRTMNMEITSNLPSKEGLNVGAIISILYRIKPDEAVQVVENIGLNYEEVVINSVFRSASADVCAKFFAKDMHTAQRSVIEKEITDRMSQVLNKRGFEIEAVLLKTIQLPVGLSRAVEQKLEAEQDAQRMQFLLEREKLEAQRKLVEAKGISDAQKIIAEGLSPAILQWKSIEAFKELSKSENSKVIITDGKSPMLIDGVSGN